MKIAWKTYAIGGKSVTVKTTVYSPNDKSLVSHLYNDWLKLNRKIRKVSTRGINIHEAISENSFCLFYDTNCIRVVGMKNAKCSFDVLNIKNGKRIQIKASSIPYDLSSFGPRSEWDELYFLDFSREDGTFDVYKIDHSLIYGHSVNAKQSFKEQQEQNRRPRFSIKKLIEENKIKPVKTCILK